MNDEKAENKSAEKNTGMALLCYLSVLVLIPLLTEAKDDKFVKFHIKQGIVLLIASIIVYALAQLPVIGWFIIGPIGGIFLLILAILGILNAVSGKEQDLPLIGKYAEKISI